MTSRAPGETKRRLTSFYSFPQNLALYNFWMFHRAWKEINLSGLKVVLETNQLYISWGVKSMFLDPGVRSWIWSGEKQNMVQLKVAHNSKQLLGLELRYWKNISGSLGQLFYLIPLHLQRNYSCICTFFLRILPFVYFHLRVSHRAHHHLYLTPTHVDLWIVDKSFDCLKPTMVPLSWLGVKPRREKPMFMHT